MKAALITLHCLRNFGSVLQTYATQTVLEREGFDCTIIDYVPKGLTLKTGILTIRPVGGPLLRLIRTAGAALTFSARQYVTRRFNRRYLHLSDRVYHRFSELCENPPDADVYLSGSDQIWNTQNHNEPDDLWAYYLGFVPEGKPRIGYAASIGKDAFDPDEAETVKKYLARYDAVSVREAELSLLLRDIGIADVETVVDPTLLLTAEEWRLLISKKRVPRSPYIFVYNLNRNADMKSYAVLLSQKTGLPIVNFADALDFIPGAHNRLLNTPLDFLNYLANASFVLTDSFHGTAFSINFNRQFLVFPAPKYNARIESLLHLAGLSSRLYDEKREETVQAVSPIDYETVNHLMEDERLRSMRFLHDHLARVTKSDKN